MGIKGLWKEVHPQNTHISQFRGQRVAIDSYCWLHRGVIGSAVALATGTPCDKFIAAYMARIDMLIRYGVTPVCVFDGTSMPMKAETDKQRHAKRENAKQEGMTLLKNGNQKAAIECFEKSIDVTTELAFAVIQVLKRRGIECIVAPFEADPQCAYLCREGYAQAVITEDSDLIVYGGGTVLAKMDGNGNCVAVQMDRVRNSESFANLSPAAFVLVCVLSGCDYVSSLHSIGMKTAIKLVSKCSSIPELMSTFATQYGFSQRDLDLYETNVHKALYCFAHHNVYDPGTKTIVPFTPLAPHVKPQADLVGKVWPQEVAESVCGLHETDPSTLKSYAHDYRSSVEKYLKESEKGQRKLNEFSAFERHKAHKVVLAAATTDGAGRRFGHRDTAFADNPVSGYFGGECSAEQGKTPRRIVVKSKYFSSSNIDDIIESSPESGSPSRQLSGKYEYEDNTKHHQQHQEPVGGDGGSYSSSSQSSSPLASLVASGNSIGSLCASAQPQPPVTTLLRGTPRVGLSQPFSNNNSQQLSPLLPNTSVAIAEPAVEESSSVPCSSPEDAVSKGNNNVGSSATKGVLFGGTGSQTSPNCTAPSAAAAGLGGEEPSSYHVPKPVTAATFLQLLPDSPMPSPARLPPNLVGSKRQREEEDTTTREEEQGAGITPPPLPQTAASPLALTEAHKVTVTRDLTPPPQPQEQRGVASVRDMLLKSTMSATSHKNTRNTPSGSVPKTLFTVHDLDDDTPPKGPSNKHTFTTIAVDCDDVSNGSVESVPSANNTISARGAGATSLSTSTRRAMDMMAALRSRTAQKASSSSTSTAPQQSSSSSDPAAAATPSAVNVFKALAFQRGLARNTQK